MVTSGRPSPQFVIENQGLSTPFYSLSTPRLGDDGTALPQTRRDKQIYKNKSNCTTDQKKTAIK